MSSCGEDDNDDVAQRSRMKTPAYADQRRNGGENSAALVSGQQQVADVPLAAGRAHLRGKRKTVSLQLGSM